MWIRTETGKDAGMRFRLGVLVGFGAGYYLGAKAGRERYHEINQWMGRAKESDVLETVTDKAKAATDLGMERAKDLVDGAFNKDGSPAGGTGTEAGFASRNQQT